MTSDRSAVVTPTHTLCSARRSVRTAPRRAHMVATREFFFWSDKTRARRAQDICKTSARHLQDARKTRARRAQDACKTRARHLQDICKTRVLHMSCRRPNRCKAQQKNLRCISGGHPEIFLLRTAFVRTRARHLQDARLAHVLQMSCARLASVLHAHASCTRLARVLSLHARTIAACRGAFPDTRMGQHNASLSAPLAERRSRCCCPT